VVRTPIGSGYRPPPGFGPTPRGYSPTISFENPGTPSFEHHNVEETATVLRVHGELDIGSADALREALDAAEAEDTTVIRIDATGVQFVDSTALGVILAAAQRMTARGGRLELMNTTPTVRRILDMTLIARTVHLIP
jgi:anti-sigma B factor antagonist